LANQGIKLFQGYLFAKPAFESFPPVHYPQIC
jgi:EAL domain-containing protein (putative c-di-GMP-specific phosphodiesterase class I)